MKSIKTKRGNYVVSVINKNLSKRYIGLQKVLTDQKSKPPVVTVYEVRDGIRWERKVSNKPPTNCSGLMAALAADKPVYRYITGFKPVIVTHYVLSDYGKQRLARMRKKQK